METSLNPDPSSLPSSPPFLAGGVRNDHRAVMVRMPTPVYRRLRVEAARADMSVSAYVVRIVTDTQAEAK